MITSTFEKTLVVGPSVCDYSGKLSIPDAFAVCMDIATEHADALGLGLNELSRKNLFWLAVKTKIHFADRPAMGDRVTVETWPEKPDRIRCVRDYTITRGNEVIVSGKTEWMMINMQTGRLQAVNEVYPAEMVIAEKLALDEPFSNVCTEAFTDVIGEYTVKSTDIDVGGHMNNVAYIRALAGLWSVDTWKNTVVSGIDVTYKAQCFEGNVLSFTRKEADGKTMIHATLPDGKIAVQIILY